MTVREAATAGPAAAAPRRRRLQLAAGLAGEIREHAERSWPEECCGVLIGEHLPGRSEVRQVVAVENRSRHPRRRWRIGPRDLVAVLRRSRQEGRDLVGFYHSHPAGPAVPSVADVEEVWPRTSYLVVALEAGRVVGLRSWRRDAGGLAEERVVASRPSPTLRATRYRGDLRDTGAVAPRGDDG